jgi:hypothetical protein
VTAEAEAASSSSLWWPLAGESATDESNRPSGIGTAQGAKRMGSALVSAALVELALFTMT